MRYNSNTIIQAPHGTSIIFSYIRENYADDGWLKTSGAYQEIFFIHVLDEEMFAAAAAAATTGCNCFYTASNNEKVQIKIRDTQNRREETHTRERARKQTHIVIHNPTAEISSPQICMWMECIILERRWGGEKAKDSETK